MPLTPVEKKTVYTLRIVYKSGYTHDFDVYDFEISGGTWTWKHVDDNNKPIKLGIDDVAAIWQIGIREVLA